MPARTRGAGIRTASLEFFDVTSQPPQDYFGALVPARAWSERPRALTSDTALIRAMGIIRTRLGWRLLLDALP
jgi:hypothetical protein